MGIFQILRQFKSIVLKNAPIYAHFGITHRCNLKCKMCDVINDKKEELSLEQIEKLFINLRKIGVSYISIGGGEPFLRNDLPNVVKAAVRSGLIVRVLTNGTIINEKLANNLVESGLRELSVSLQSLDQAKQNSLNNSNESFSNIMHNLKYFSKVLLKNNRNLLINTVVSPKNLNELVSISDFAKKLGYYISFVPIEHNNQSEFIFNKDENVLIDDTFNKLIMLKNGRKSNILNSSLFLRRTKEYLKTGIHSWKCDAGKLYYSISPAGEISGCHMYASNLSLLNEETIKYITTQDYRLKNNENISKCPGCMRPCWAEITNICHDKKSFFEMCRIRLGY